MKSIISNNSTKALVLRQNTSLTIIKNFASKTVIISSKTILAAFILTFVNLFV